MVLCQYVEGSSSSWFVLLTELLYIQCMSLVIVCCLLAESDEIEQSFSETLATLHRLEVEADALLARYLL